MEELTTVASTGWRNFSQNKAVCCCASSICIVLFGVWLTFMIYLGVFAFDNPDKDVWLGHMQESGDKAVKMQLFSSYEELTAANANSHVHMHGRLVAWFTWGFYQFILPIALLPIVACLLICGGPVAGLFCYAATMLSCGCSVMAWFITGIIWRWSTDGQFAVGTLIPSGKTADEWSTITKAEGSLYQVKSGNFMAYYYLTILIL